MIKITIYRHGETNWNKKKLMQGCSNIPLNLTGLVQAFELAKKLENEKIDLILSSDLSRAHQTGRVATKKHDPNIPFILSKNLRELNFGDFEGKPKAEFFEKAAEQLAILDDCNHPLTFDTKIPGGESHRQLINRFLQALEDSINTYPLSRNIVIFGHYGLMRVIYKYLTKEVKEFANCSGLELYYNLETGKIELP